MYKEQVAQLLHDLENDRALDNVQIDFVKDLVQREIDGIEPTPAMEDGIYWYISEGSSSIFLVENNLAYYRIAPGGERYPNEHVSQMPGGWEKI